MSVKAITTKHTLKYNFTILMSDKNPSVIEGFSLINHLTAS